MPGVYDQFMEIANKLENHYKDMQDMEFTIEEGKLFFLQTRNGKRTANAALRIAVEMVEEGLITTDEALMRVEPKQLDQLLHPAFDQAALKAAKAIGKGLPASSFRFLSIEMTNFFILSFNLQIAFWESFSW